MATTYTIGNPITSNYQGGSSVSNFSVQAPALVLNGATVPSGLNFDLDLGMSQSDLIGRTFDFVNAGNAGAQSFLSGVITNSNAMLPAMLAQVTPVYQAQAQFAATNQANATAIASAAQGSSGGGFGCYITTAVCQRDGKPDDCEELQTLRHFRDTYMKATIYREALVKRYYELAPAIVRSIQGKPERIAESIYRELRLYIGKAIDAIKRGDNARAMVIYCDMVGYAEGVA